jgi:hypothetical protein
MRQPSSEKLKDNNAGNYYFIEKGGDDFLHDIVIPVQYT